MTNSIKEKIEVYFNGMKETVNYHVISLKTGKVNTFLSKTKETNNKLIMVEKVQYHDKERDMSFHRYYHNEFFIGCMVCFCGYDRQPKRNAYIEDLLIELKETNDNEDKAINEMEDKAYRKLETKVYTKLKHWIEDL